MAKPVLICLFFVLSTAFAHAAGTRPQVDREFMNRLQKTLQATAASYPVAINRDRDVLVASVGPGAAWREVVRFRHWPKGLSPEIRIKDSQVLRARIAEATRRLDIADLCVAGTRSRLMLDKGVLIRRVALAPDMGHVGLYEIQRADCNHIQTVVRKKRRKHR